MDFLFAFLLRKVIGLMATQVESPPMNMKSLAMFMKTGIISQPSIAFDGMLSNLPSKRWFDSIGICGNSSSVERWHSSQRVGFDSLFPLNPYSSDK